MNDNAVRPGGNPMTADLYAAARAGLFSTLAGIGVIESGTWVGFEPEDADTILAALDAPARAALLAWLLPSDRLAAALEVGMRGGYVAELPTELIARQTLAALVETSRPDPWDDPNMEDDPNLRSPNRNGRCANGARAPMTLAALTDPATDGGVK